MVRGRDVREGVEAVVATILSGMRETLIMLAFAAMIVAALGVLVGVVDWLYKRHL